MCFSVAASFTAGTFLIGFGVMTLSLARRRKEVPFAAIPLLFGLQQLSEGVVWISFGAGWEPINFWATQFFSFSLMFYGQYGCRSQLWQLSHQSRVAACFFRHCWPAFSLVCFFCTRCFYIPFGRWLQTGISNTYRLIFI